MRSEQVAEKTG